MKARIDFPAGAGERLALSFARPAAVFVARRLDEVSGVIAAAETLARGGRWVVGFVAYEAAPAFDAAFRTLEPDPRLPLAHFAAYEAPIDEAQTPGRFACGPWRMATPPAEAAARIESVRRGIAAGDWYQVNLTTRLRAGFQGDPAALFEALRAAQPDGYGTYLDAGDWQIASVSPELFFEWRPDGTLTTRPMKGTAARVADPQADAAAALSLAASEKDRAENLMIVDLLRNDLARVAITGSVAVPALFEVEALPSAWQMTSTVACRTRADVGLADVFGALFPCGSITGAPKVAAMAAIADLEKAPRGAYCGAVGVLRPGGHATFNVAIRTVALDAQGGEAECGVGSG
ncbi:MAG: chorismate-binding protein, partial [Ignavibacteria bacterium]